VPGPWNIQKEIHLNSNPNYTLKVPQPGGRIDILPRYEDEIRSTGEIASVVDEGLVDDLENYLVKTKRGESLRVIVLRPESPMDDEEQRCFMLLNWHRSVPPAGDGFEEPEVDRRVALKKMASGIWDLIKQRWMVFLALIVILIGILLFLFGYSKLGEAFMDLGMKIFFFIGAAMNRISLALPAILHTVSDWIHPIHFLTSDFA
jgi:hypothetical protein